MFLFMFIFMLDKSLIKMLLLYGKKHKNTSMKEMNFLTKIRDQGSNTTITSVPSALVNLFDMKKGDKLEWTWVYDKPDEIKIKLVKEE